jgi:hypothetical protein
MMQLPTLRRRSIKGAVAAGIRCGCSHKDCLQEKMMPSIL